mgnify:CR=1 FL=1
MQHHVIVTFSKDEEFEYRLSKAELVGISADEARKWFDKEFTVLECEVASPTGKVLIIDRILSVAKYAGAKRFQTQPAWAEQFAKYTTVVLGRDLTRVDVAAYAIGY